MTEATRQHDITVSPYVDRNDVVGLYILDSRENLIRGEEKEIYRHTHTPCIIMKRHLLGTVGRWRVLFRRWPPQNVQSLTKNQKTTFWQVNIFLAVQLLKLRLCPVVMAMVVFHLVNFNYMPFLDFISC